MNPQLNPETIEAALKWVYCLPVSPEEHQLLRAFDSKADLVDISACILASEVEQLRLWKKQAIDVLEMWEQVWVAAGKPGTLGASKAIVTKFEVESLRAQADAVCASEWRLSKGAEENPSDGTIVGECSGGQFVVFAPSKIPIYCPGCGRKVKIQTNEQQ